MRTVIILSISSDIGRHLAHKYLAQGCRVVGTFRHDTGLKALKAHPQCSLIKCDVAKSVDLARLASKLRKSGIRWDVFISCVGDLLPAGPFFGSNFKAWAGSVHINAVAQLQALHALHALRSRGGVDVVFFAGGGMNSAVTDLSAYTVSKIMLAKMCEFLDAENRDLNIFIVGPGWTRTKIHRRILDDRRSAAAKARETRKALKSKKGTSLDEIFECIDWLCREGKALASGRNFSVMHDPWRKSQRAKLTRALARDPDMYKLRRSGNDF